MTFTFLKNHPEVLPIIADWYFQEWGYLMENHSVEKEKKRQEIYLNDDKIPFILLGMEKDELIGVIQIKYREMSIYPEKEHWLGGVYVVKAHRGKGVARAIIEKALQMMPDYGVEKLHLQTENLTGGLYAKMGWQALKEVVYNGVRVLVMERKI